MFQISPEQWMHSAAQAIGQGEDLAAHHLSTDHRIHAAQVGWQGASAIALSLRVDSWWEESRALVSRIGDHAYGLQQAAIQHGAAEEDRAQALAQLGVGSRGMAGGRRE